MHDTEKTIALLGAVALGLWLFRDRFNPSIDVRFPHGFEEPDLPEEIGIASDNYWEGEFLGASPQVAAFLYMIRRAEHRAAHVSSGMDYRIFYGGSVFNDLSDHPAITGEKSGVRLREDQCRAAGFANGVCVSTAAGAYQFIKPTWKALREDSPRLPSFEHEYQDLAAIRLLERIGALGAIHNGDISRAIALASKQWASLPGSVAKQNPKTIDEVMAYFQEGGGTFA